MAPSYYFSNLQKIFSFFILELWADYKAGFIDMKLYFRNQNKCFTSNLFRFKNSNIPYFYIVYYENLWNFTPELTSNTACIYMFKVNNENTKKRCEMCSNLKMSLL